MLAPFCVAGPIGPRGVAIFIGCCAIAASSGAGAFALCSSILRQHGSVHTALRDSMVAMGVPLSEALWYIRETCASLLLPSHRHWCSPLVTPRTGVATGAQLQPDAVPVGCTGRQAAACQSMAAARLGDRLGRRSPEIVSLALGRRCVASGARGVAVGADVQRVGKSYACPCRSVAASNKEQAGCFRAHTRLECPIGRCSGSGPSQRRRMPAPLGRPCPGGRRLPFGTSDPARFGLEGVPLVEVLLGSAGVLAFQASHAAHGRMAGSWCGEGRDVSASSVSLLPGRRDMARVHAPVGQNHRAS